MATEFFLKLWDNHIIQLGVWQTVYMTFLTSLFAYVIGLPLGVPGILSAFVLGFLEAWNAIEQPMVFLESARLRPLSLYLTNISAADAGLALAASLLMLAPAMLIFLFGQKYLELGIQASGLKDV